NDDASLLKPTIGGKLMRDPCIIQGPDGLFHMVWTTSWHDQGIGVAHSKDLIEWSEQQFVPVMKHEPESKNCWAPEITWDPDGQQYVIYWATTIPGHFGVTAETGDGDWNHRMYCTTTRDFKTYTKTQLFYEPGFNVIDSTICKKGDQYVMILKDETRHPPGKDLRVAHSKNVTGPWSAASKPFTLKWVEGPSCLKVGEWWIVYYDEYSRHTYGAMRTKDFKNWELISDKLRFPKGTAHGTAFTVSEDVLQKLLEKKKNVRPAPRPTEARPLLLGNWADPTVLKEGDDYYMTHSSFNFQPGLLIWHSKDLRTWTPVSHAVTNQPGSIWAPELIKHEGQYIVYYPANGENWAVTAEHIEGPWSPPVSIDLKGIDPGHIADADGKRYMHRNDGVAVKLDHTGLQTIGEPKKVYDGWPIPKDWIVECFCLESPKLNVRNGWYYLTSAQGGAGGPATSHMVVSARSRHPLGPWENSPYNPIIHTWDADETWWSKGHGTLVEGPDGNWFCVFHGYLNGFRTMGRCTLIEPIEWTDDGWFRVPDDWPAGWDTAGVGKLPQGDSFDGSTLGIQWQFYQEYDETRFELKEDHLILNGQGTTPGLSRPLCMMAMHRAYVVETELEIQGDGAAGLMLFASPQSYIALSITQDGTVQRLQEGFDSPGQIDGPQIKGRRVRLRILHDKQDVQCMVMTNAGWESVLPGMNVTNLSMNGWPSLRPALFATNGATARFDQFLYQPLEN
ncbi:MAG: family 43 glycosylhydrolase, partial [Gammaproteobacteria bacterium]|nr:family 43 glycosylhydrolase [Gammaproteobacteria bacterium]